METLAPSLWVDSNVVDCWGAILNYEEQFKEESSPWRHFFPTGCLTNAMVNDPRLNEDQHWDIFSTEIAAQLKKEDATLSLVELTLAPSLWVDSNVVDCWGAILNYEEQFKEESSPWRHFFPTGCLTNAMVNDPRLNEDQHWDIFSTEIAAQLKKEDATLSLVELKKLFSRYLSYFKHPKHASVAKVKPRCPKLKWRTQMNHIDCGVFAMIHMESYMGQAASKWDVGLCAESKQQKSLLKRMRFRIATKILLHEENVHAQKMYDLACRFHNEFDDPTKISMIVDAIKNRGQRESQE
ncbi:hypothetical protein CTI12_AA123170 [Artemisia annua]|uniref:Ulp1 protease family, C-terminal catalytic domain-containing protein n=1 Tax=Artemisia annua TaxID=35608 RepID=A0A2U1PQT5_ARTAN|nr:hypothetical protein CTI12_AA123170 [Artemisia annua]